MSDDGAFYLKAYLWSHSEVPWSEEQMDQFLDEFADFLVEKGFGNPELDSGENLSSLVLIGYEEIPEDPAEFLQGVVENGVEGMLIPMDGQHDKKVRKDGLDD